MDRRAFLTSMSVALGTQMILPLQRALAAGEDFDPVKMTGGDVLLLPDAGETVAALSEVIIPTTDTPGAIAAGVPNYIAFMLGNWYDEAERDRFAQSLKQFMATITGRFVDRSNDEQIAIVQALHDGQYADMPEGGREFFEHIKQLTLAGYYTSEVGMTVERRYLPVPGHFDGHYPYADVGTLFTA
ncbi:MAG: gluconate 2-dehydrogenase subunit 3 family protein [Pseudomonadota bacterium]